MTTEQHGVTESADGAVFTRQATGLVRSVSPLSTLVFNMLTAPAPFVLSIALFWTLGAFPGANLYVALILAYLCGIVFAFAVGTISSAMPRSGGDYVLVGRTLHPALGLVSSFCFTAGVLLSVAFLTLAMVTAAIAPSLVVIGLIGGSGTLVDWGSTLQTSHPWQFGVGMVFLLLAALLAGSGWKWSLRVQNIGFLVGAAGLFVTAVVVMLKSGADFHNAFNQYANPITGDQDSYAQVISAAKKQGANLDPGSSWSNTWPAFGAVLGFSVYTWFSAHIAGEVRQAGSWRTTGTMIGAAVLNLATLLIMTAVFFHGFGSQFFTAINAVNGTDAYPFAAPPFYVLLASIAGGSTILAVFLGFSVSLIFFLVLWLNLVQPVRALFAYAFDGVLPLKVAYVSPRTRVPVVALAITVAMCTLLYIWAVWGTKFFTVYATAVMITVVALFLLGVSAAVLAYRRPEIWRASVTTRRVVGVPLTTIAGLGAILVALINGWVFLKYPALGITDRTAALRNVALVVIAALVVYGIADRVRGHQGIRLAQAASEIPPD